MCIETNYKLKMYNDALLIFIMQNFIYQRCAFDYRSMYYYFINAYVVHPQFKVDSHVKLRAFRLSSELVSL